MAVYADGSREEKRETGDAVINQDQHGESHGGHADPMIREVAKAEKFIHHQNLKIAY